MVIAVIADIVGSRELGDRSAAQRALDETIAQVERDRPLAVQPLTPTVGDEQQGVYRALPDALLSLLMIQLRLPEGLAFRFGIGVGEVRSVASVHRDLADGPGWYAARAAIEIVHAREQRAVPRTRTWIVGAPGQDEVMENVIAASNAYVLARDELVGAMSERERHLTYGRLVGRSQQELAAQEGISQPSVSKSLRSAGAAALIEGVAALRGGVRMILAGFVLLAVGGTDLVRQFVPRRWVGYVVAAAVILLLGIGGDALLPALLGLGAGALWIWSMPDAGSTRAGFWPAVALAALSIGAVVWGGTRDTAGLIGEMWTLRSPFGEVPFDLVVLALGAGVFLLESANLVVRAALDGEHTWRPAEVSVPVPPSDASSAPVSAAAHAGETAAVSAVIPADPRHGFKGGRLIGPLERVLVMILTLAAAYPVLAAMLAAKGIVRFPEISRDGETGARAEYFLVGSLVSWVIGLGAAFLVWWAAHS